MIQSSLPSPPCADPDGVLVQTPPMRRSLIPTAPKSDVSHAGHTQMMVPVNPAGTNDSLRIRGSLINTYLVSHIAVVSSVPCTWLPDVISHPVSNLVAVLSDTGSLSSAPMTSPVSCIYSHCLLQLFLLYPVFNRRIVPPLSTTLGIEHCSTARILPEGVSPMPYYLHP